MSTQNDSAFLENLQSNNVNVAHSTLKTIYDKHWRFARDLMRSKGLSQMDCEDLYQDAMTIFYKKIRSQNFELSSTLKTYLFGIIKNLIFSQRRKNNKTSPSEIREDSIIAEDLEQLYLNQERKNILIHKMQSLGAKCHEVLRLYYFDQLSMKEIAIKMDYSSDSVAKNKKSLCLNKLKQSFSPKSKQEL